MRTLKLPSYLVTVGQLVEEINTTLKAEGIDRVLHRTQFYRRVSRLLPQKKREENGWRLYTRDEADYVKQKIIQKYRDKAERNKKK